MFERADDTARSSPDEGEEGSVRSCEQRTLWNGPAGPLRQSQAEVKDEAPDRRWRCTCGAAMAREDARLGTEREKVETEKTETEKTPVLSRPMGARLQPG